MPNPLTLQLPNPPDINSPGSVTVRVTGGVPPYDVSCPPPPQGVTVTPLGQHGHTFTVTAPSGITAGTKITVVASDSDGNQDNGDLTVQ